MKFPVFEAIMLVCFGLAWPLSIIKSWKSRTSKGKSIFFMTVILIGYISGLTHKLFWMKKTDAVIWLYALNAMLVLIDIILYFRNLRIDRGRD
ncbi:MAG: hypothetical protein R6V06_01910 [Kiritimatiellia bacterium]